MVRQPKHIVFPKPVPVFRFPDFTLREMIAADAPAFAQLIASPDVNRYLQEDYPITPKTVRQFVETQHYYPGYMWAVDVEGEFAGCFNIGFVEGEKRTGLEVGYWLGQPYWGHGIARRGVNMICKWAFAEKKAHRIEAWVLGDNIKSFNLLQQSGFVAEGVLRQAIYRAGQWMDATVLTRTDPANAKRLLSNVLPEDDDNEY